MRGATGTVYDMTRGAVATDEWVQFRCTDLPPVYQLLLPNTDDAAVLLREEKKIRERMRRDFEAYQAEQASPWLKLGPQPEAVVLDHLTPEQLIEVGLQYTREIGLPSPIKPGFEDHPDVAAAREAAPHTAEFIAHERRRELKESAQTLRSEYQRAVAANDQNADELYGKLEAIAADLKTAEATCRRLAKDVSAAIQPQMKIA